MECLVLTGISGAGKSTAIHALEDLGFFCADNVPAQLTEEFFKLCETAYTEKGKFAAVVDIRGFSAFGCNAVQLKERLSQMTPQPKILFVDASDEVILKRYKETRRRHPVLDEHITELNEAVAFERKNLSGLREVADYVIDTSSMKPADFKDRIRELANLSQEDAIHLHISSFGFKNGLPQDADMVFDVRCLPNPFYVNELKHGTGLDKKVYDYVFSFEESEALYKKMLDFIQYSLPLYKKEGKSRLVIDFGCTGGHHRSVAFAQRLVGDMKKAGHDVTVSHRDIEKKERE